MLVAEASWVSVAFRIVLVEFENPSVGDMKEGTGVADRLVAVSL